MNFFFPIGSRSGSRFRHGREAFSLLEFLAVVAIIGVLLTLMAPAIQGISGSAGRKGAVNLVMGVIDQARVAALEQGRNVHVVLARKNYPEPDAILVLREDEQGLPTEQLTRWMKLPQGVLFQANLGVFSQPVDPTWSEVLATQEGAIGFARLTFGPSGTILFPTGSNNNSRRIHLLEGVREGENETPKAQGVEVISVARYTGRPQLDISFQ